MKKLAIALFPLSFIKALVIGALRRSGEEATRVPTLTLGLSEIYPGVKPAVVAIALVQRVGGKVDYSPFGSGFCVDPDGIIVTARHVITDYYEAKGTPLPKFHTESSGPIPHPDFRVVFVRKMSSGFEAMDVPVINWISPLAGDHPEDDVAVLRITRCPEKWGAQYHCVQLGDLSTAREGDEVATCGYPLRPQPIRSMNSELSKGIISRIDEQFGADKKWKVTKLVLDINVNPGNSGGPVFETRSGKVMGLVSYTVQDPEMIPEELRESLIIPTGIVYCVPVEDLDKAIAALKSAESTSADTSASS